MLIEVFTTEYGPFYTLELPFAPQVGDEICLPGGDGSFKVIERTVMLRKIEVERNSMAAYEEPVISSVLHLKCVTINDGY